MSVFYFVGFVIAFIMILLIRYRGEIKLSDVNASLICGVLSWFTVVLVTAFILTACLLGLYEKAENIVIFKKKSY